jgi:putative nucleotidyltransferase with HDIG domain
MEPAGAAAYDDLVRRFASAVRATQLYSADHPLVTKSLDDWRTAITRIHQQHASISFGIIDGQFVVADTPLPRASAAMPDLIARLMAHRIERISIQRGVTDQEVGHFVQGVAALAARPVDGGVPAISSTHLRVGQITQDERPSGGVSNDMATIRQLYAKAIAAAEGVWESAAAEGTPDVAAALQTIDGLTDAVTQNRTALVALTAMQNYDNYTFTHMVNVSILTMGQARALGIDGRLLREFGLSALMHDIGKVRTPKEILNKPEKLTDDEFTIMRRHVVDGAEILRRTPEMPVLAPVVAFEHHLRLDGSGYPFGVQRTGLNLCTMLCSIADVYDAMRSQRVYQAALPTDRILAVLKRGDGREFDRHLIRRFVQLLGVYPAGTLVKLRSGEVAVVTRVHAPDPHRPRVRLLFDVDGTAIDAVVERNLWLEQEADDEGPRGGIAAPLDAAQFGIDPLSFVPVDAAR